MWNSPGAVYPRGVKVVVRDGLHLLHEQKDGEGFEHAGQDDAGIAVYEPQPVHDDEERYHSDLRRYHHRGDIDAEDDAAAPEAELGKGEGSHGGGDEGYEREGHRDKEAVAYRPQEGEA